MPDPERVHELGVLDGLTGADLDKPSADCPPLSKAFVGTLGGRFMMVMLHPAMHRFQVTVAGQMAGRKPLIA